MKGRPRNPLVVVAVTIACSFAFSFAFSFVSSGAVAAESVLLLNGTRTDVTIEAAPAQEILPGESLRVDVPRLRAVRFGQEVLEYRPDALAALSRGAVSVLQAGPKGCLYVLPASARKPVERLPKQPSGFPLCPSRQVDLT